MPYSGRLPAISNGRPVLILGFDATHALCVDHEGRLVYVEHGNLDIPWHGDAEAVYWLENGYVVQGAADSSTGDAFDVFTGADDTRE